MTVADRLSASAHDFERLVWPVIKDALGGGRVVPVETVAEAEFARDLDVLAGIDVWHIAQGDAGIRGIASRIQWGHRNWRTFTVRYSRRSGYATEYHKRCAALNGGHGFLYPHITVQAYIDKRPDGALLGCGMAYTSDVIALADPDNESRRRTNPQDGSTFLVVSYDDLKAAGRRLYEHTVEHAEAPPEAA